MRTPLHQFAIIARAGVRAQRRRTRPAPQDLAGLRDALAGSAETRLLRIPARGEPLWHDTGLALAPGDTVTTFATGRVSLSRLLDVWVGPHLQLWARAGGPVFRGTRATHTFTADTAAPLELASYPGGWADPSGTPPADRPRVSGGLDVLVARWAPDADPLAVLERLARAHPLAAAEHARLAAGDPLVPPGWRHLWDIGPAETFTPDPERPDAIACRTHADVAILQRDADHPLTDATRLRWAWRVDALPSELAEDTLLTHDYLSVALEFDNGQDLTWHWSAALPVEHHYRCPIPAWKHRETHIVVRSGTAELGRWLSEERPVARDYATAVGAPPARIVRMWLIANSVFQRGEGRATFADLELIEG
jgi:hypothetical protein